MWLRVMYFQVMTSSVNRVWLIQRGTSFFFMSPLDMIDGGVGWGQLSLVRGWESKKKLFNPGPPMF